MVVDSLRVTWPLLLEAVPAMPMLTPAMIGVLGTLGTDTDTPIGIPDNPGVTTEIGGTMIPETIPWAPVTGALTVGAALG